MKADQSFINFPDFVPMNPPSIDENTRWLVGVSGGKDSSAVLLWMLHQSGIDKSKIICTFSDTGNEHEWTYAHIQKISEELHPVITLKPKKDFYELALSKKRFPSTKARFCTQELKIYPSEDYIQELRCSGYNVISVSGVRADESEDRKKLGAWDMAGFNVAYPQWRPLIHWNISDVLEIHARHNFPLNPLYEAGAMRVGCFPCIMSRKSEMRNIALNFTDRIDMIRKAEREFEKRYGRYSSFFPRTHIAERFRTKPFTNKDGETIMVATIDDVVTWSLTGKGAKGSYEDDEPETNTIGCMSGFCE